MTGRRITVATVLLSCLLIAAHACAGAAPEPAPPAVLPAAEESVAASGDGPAGTAASSPDGMEDGEESPPAIDFDRMLQEVEALRRFAGEAADGALLEVARNRKGLTSAVEDLKGRRQELVDSVAHLQSQYNRQIDRLKTLQARQREDGVSRTSLEGAFRIAAAAIRDRMAGSAYASLEPERVDAVAALAGSTSFPSLEEIGTVVDTLFAELEHSGAVDIRGGPVTLLDGSTVEAEVLRVGGLLAAAHLRDGALLFLQPAGGGRRLVAVQAEVPGSELHAVDRAFASGGAVVPVDFSGGGVFRRFIGRKSLGQHILAGGALIWPIAGLGTIALLIGLYRYVRLLRVRFGNAEVLRKFFSLARDGNLPDARAQLQAGGGNVPVYRVLSHMLDEWGGAGIASMEKCRDEAIMTQIAPLERGISFVAVAAAVAPLLGLLGTVTGMIATFDIITIFGNSDPKLLSGGISVALVTTELGLVAAIPLMFLHFFLSRRVATLVNDMEEKGAVLIARVSAGGSAKGDSA